MKQNFIANDNPDTMNMKQSGELVQVMNSLLAEVLADINQNMVHAEMCESWGYKKLQMAFRKQIMDKLNQSEWLIDRILFLKGTPRVSKLNTVVKLGKTVPDMIINANKVDGTSIKAYNNAIALAWKAKDQGTIEILSRILEMEEHLVEWVRAQRAQMDQMGLENYLNNQTEAAAN